MLNREVILWLVRAPSPWGFGSYPGAKGAGCRCRRTRASLYPDRGRLSLMPSQAAERRLAAIMFTDIVGYTALRARTRPAAGWVPTASRSARWSRIIGAESVDSRNSGTRK